VANQISGKIVEIDDEGNLVTDITSETLADAPGDDSVTIRCDDHETRSIFPADHDQPPMTLVAILNTDDRLQITIVGDSAKIMLGVAVGTPVEVLW